MKKLHEITIRIDKESMEEIARAINIRRMIGQFYGPCDTLAFIIGVKLENGEKEVEINNIKELASKLADELNAK